MKLPTEALNVYFGIFISLSFVETYQMVFSNKVWKVRVIFLCFRKSLYVPTKNVEITLGPFLLPASASRRLRCWLRIHCAFIWFYSRIKSHQCITSTEILASFLPLLAFFFIGTNSFRLSIISFGNCRPMEQSVPSRFFAFCSLSNCLPAG